MIPRIQPTAHARDEGKKAEVVVAMAASAGGLSALKHILNSLPDEFEAAVVIVQHLAPHRPSFMHEILGRHSGLRVTQAREGDELMAGHVYLAPPDHHLHVNPEKTLSLLSTAPIHYVRPSADVLFTSLAATFKERAIAVVLTGMGEDGAPGVLAVKHMKGTVIAQDEATSQFFAMPAAAIRTRVVDEILPLDEIPAALVRRVQTALTGHA
jgi:two-component system chemotaxis response regulator CheB